MQWARRTGAKSEPGKTLGSLPQTSFIPTSYCASKAWFVLFFKENHPFPVPLGEISSKPIVGEAIARGTIWHWSWPWLNIRSQTHEHLCPKGISCCPVIDTDGEIMLLFLLHYVWQRCGLRNILKDVFISLELLCHSPSYVETMLCSPIRSNVEVRTCGKWEWG